MFRESEANKSFVSVYLTLKSSIVPVFMNFLTVKIDAKHGINYSADTHIAKETHGMYERGLVQGTLSYSTSSGKLRTCLSRAALTRQGA